MDLYTIRNKLNEGVPLTSLNLRVTDYARVSTNHLEQKNSLKNQVEHFEEMIKKNKNWIYVNGYVDDGISGTSAEKRNNFLRMIEDARLGKFDLIVTKEISRFSRNTLDSIKYSRELLSYGVAVLFVNDNINTAMPDSELRLTIMASMAQDEIRRLSERVKFGMNRSIRNGIILGNNTLYGYEKDRINGSLKIVDKEASIVKRLFFLYAIDNLSINRIALIFNKEGIKTCRGKEWCVSTLTRMLKNPKYKGYYCGNKTEVIDYMTKKIKRIPENDWVIYEDKLKIPPIISEYLWNRANERLKKRARVFGSDYKSDKIMYKNRYPLSVKIYCSLHNDVFHRRIQCKASDDVTWVCAKHLRLGKKTSGCLNLRESEIYTIFDDIINYLEIDLLNVFKILFELYLDNNDCIDLDNSIDLLNRKRDKLLIKKNKLLELNVEGALSNSEFNSQNSDCNKELAIVEEKINVLKKQKCVNNENKFKERVEKEIKQMFKKNELRNELIRLLLRKIIVSRVDNDNMRLKIFFNISKDFFKREVNQFLIQQKFFEKDYKFKRGYNTTGTRRYIVEYQVTSYVYD